MKLPLTTGKKTHQNLLKERLKELDVIFKNIDFEADIAHSLNKFIKETKVDLLAHGTVPTYFLGKGPR